MNKFKIYVTVTEKKTGVVHMNKTIMVLDGDKKDINDLINGLTAVKQDIKENVFDPLFNKGFVQKLKDLSIEIEL